MCQSLRRMWWRFFHLETDTVITSEDSRLDGVRDDCEILFKDMDLANIAAKSAFKKPNRDSMKKNWKFGNWSGYWNIVLYLK